MLGALFVLAIAAGALAAGVGYVRAAHRMRGFQTTRGHITSREVIRMATLNRGGEGRFGRGGSHAPKFTYVYEVAGTSYTGDKLGYATQGLKQSIAEQQAADMPDEVDVHYNPATPAEAYLQTNSATLGWGLIALGVVLSLGALVALAA
jgi:hypothetical protein